MPGQEAGDLALETGARREDRGVERPLVGECRERRATDGAHIGSGIVDVAPHTSVEGVEIAVGEVIESLHDDVGVEADIGKTEGDRFVHSGDLRRWAGGLPPFRRVGRRANRTPEGRASTNRAVGFA